MTKEKNSILGSIASVIIIMIFPFIGIKEITDDHPAFAGQTGSQMNQKGDKRALRSSFIILRSVAATGVSMIYVQYSVTAEKVNYTELYKRFFWNIL